MHWKCGSIKRFWHKIFFGFLNRTLHILYISRAHMDFNLLRKYSNFFCVRRHHIRSPWSEKDKIKWKHQLLYVSKYFYEILQTNNSVTKKREKKTVQKWNISVSSIFRSSWWSCSTLHMYVLHVNKSHWFSLKDEWKRFRRIGSKIV